ncbi:porin [Aequorivita echinoideorum]|uniref:Outer membrane beta-barrel protein n=1 Tax=Aequorivita echinoideorum TaxID=1549647 RepID=A0ABS5S585_9FLAO|nr:porin [Aequorivita echinoideorum]MBT0607574.1 outer membrane beta-barrel protein [Aequorivita echinoideorum]
MHRQNKLVILVALLLAYSQYAKAQIDTLWQQKPKVELTAFVDIFYVYDFNQPDSTFRQPFFYNHNRHNEFNLNLGLIKIAVQQPKYRANLALQAGTYATDNYVAEDDVFKIINEANVGIALNSKNNLWVDVGIMPSHIGFESAISSENPTLTRSLLAENSPYFMAGAKLTYSPNANWVLAAVISNGWQRIKRVQGNSLPAFGTQLTYTPSEKATLNWSTFAGTDDADENRRMRYFNNFYGLFTVSDNVTITAGFDIGLQQTTKNSENYDSWFSPIVIAQYQISEQWKTVFRAEYYEDKTGVIISPINDNGFATAAYSMNLDYSPASNLYIRAEGRFLNGNDEIFRKDDLFVTNNFFMTLSMALKI